MVQRDNAHITFIHNIINSLILTIYSTSWFLVRYKQGHNVISIYSKVDVCANMLRLRGFMGSSAKPCCWIFVWMWVERPVVGFDLELDYEMAWSSCV